MIRLVFIVPNNVTNIPVLLLRGCIVVTIFDTDDILVHIPFEVEVKRALDVLSEILKVIEWIDPVDHNVIPLEIVSLEKLSVPQHVHFAGEVIYWCGYFEQIVRI